MNKLTRKLEDMFIDITFAEDRDFDSIRDALRNVEDKFEDAFTAITFAEAGEFETAAGYITKGGAAPKCRPGGPPPARFHKFLQRQGLNGCIIERYDV